MPDNFLFSHFQNNGEDGLHLAYSYDGLNWAPLKKNKPFLSPKVGKDKLMRDPCIYPGHDGRFHLIWTVSWKEKGIGHASSDDLIHWSEQQCIPVMEHEENAQNCWAPEMIYDPEQKEYILFWATTIPDLFPDTDYQSDTGETGQGNNHRMYCTTTKDFATFSQTKLFYDPSFNVIDLNIVCDDNRYIMFLKDESNKPQTPQKNIKIAAEDGRIVIIAAMNGFKTEINLLQIMQKRIKLTGSTLRSRSLDFKKRIASNLIESVWPLLETGKIRPVIYRTFPLSQAGSAHQLMENNEHTGKIVLDLN